MSQSQLNEYQYSEEAYKDPKVLRELYHERGMALREMAPILGVSNGTIYKWMDKLGIETRSKSEACGCGHGFYRTNKDGYPRWSVSEGSHTKQVRVHQLLAIANGEDPEKVFSDGEYHVHHKNGVKWDNRPSNIEVVRAHEHSDIHGFGDTLSKERRRELAEQRERHPDGTFTPGR